MKKAIIAVLAIIVVLASVTALYFTRDTSIEYLMTATVIDYNDDALATTIETEDGNIYDFCGCFQIGEKVAVIMNDNGTEDLTDDIVVNVKGF